MAGGRRSRVAGRVLAAALCGLPVVLGGCAEWWKPAPPGDPCAWLSQTATTTDGPQTVLLADRSNSGRGTGGAKGTDAGAVLGTAAADSTWTGSVGRLSLGAFDGTTATVRWTATGAPVPAADASDAQLRRDIARGVERCVTAAAQAVAAGAPASPGTDLLGALTAAADRLVAPGRRRIVLVTDGLVNTGCADMRALPIGSMGAVARMTKRCADRRELPDLRGVTVVISGVGRNVAGPRLSTRQVVWVTDVVRAVCTATGATCTVTADPGPEREAPATQDGVADPEVSFPPVVVTLPERTLFRVDSADLSPAAERSIREAIKRIDEVQPLTVRVEGHGDSRGGVDYVRRLSEQRAGAVRELLLRHGVRNVTAVGLGLTRPRCTPEYRDGRPDEKNMACNRRVELVLTTSP